MLTRKRTEKKNLKNKNLEPKRRVNKWGGSMEKPTVINAAKK